MCELGTMPYQCDQDDALCRCQAASKGSDSRKPGDNPFASSPHPRNSGNRVFSSTGGQNLWPRNRIHDQTSEFLLPQQFNSLSAPGHEIASDHMCSQVHATCAINRVLADICNAVHFYTPPSRACCRFSKRSRAASFSRRRAADRTLASANRPSLCSRASVFLISRHLAR